MEMPQSGETRSLGRSLIDAFGQGWSKGDVDLLMSVFSADVVFVETPFTPALRGQDEVRRYWLDVPYQQSEITFSSGEIFAAGPWFSTEFKCVFRRRRTGEWVDARNEDVLASVERRKRNEQALEVSPEYFRLPENGRFHPDLGY
jgi:hypothetical protein